MSTQDGPNDTPAANSEAPVVHASPQRQLLQRKMLVPFLLLAVLIATITIAVTFFGNSQSQKTSQSTNSASQTPPVDLRAEYQNPFDKNAQYENPFENLK